MSNQHHIEKFIAQYKTVFHTDWEYTSEMLGQDLYLEGETFIEGEWITNWCNKDSLDECYIKLKKDCSEEKLKQFIYYFEEVFDKDWQWSKDFLGIDDVEIEESKELDKKLGLETIHIIAPNATFLNPKLTKSELEIANWGNRELLLKYYEEVKANL